MPPGLRNRFLPLALRAMLAGVFIYAGILKVADPQAFADSIASFRLLPDALMNPMALGLPVFEILLGSWLLCGWRKRSAAFSASVLTVVFLAALSSAAMRRLTVDCGCFGKTDPILGGHSVVTSILRDLGLLAMAVYLYIAALFDERRA